MCSFKLTVVGGSLSIIGHSAGGWLARVYMEEFTDANKKISLLLTLGSPLQYAYTKCYKLCFDSRISMV